MTAKLESLVRTAVAEAVGPLREGHERLEERIEKLEETSAENNAILLKLEARDELIAEQKKEKDAAEELAGDRQLERFKVRLAVFGTIAAAVIGLIGAAIGSHH
jgi:uncharacterized protein YigA (DUF484 family)